MAKTKISEFSATPANNTDIDSINIAEGCAPSGINDAIRELMSQLKDFQAGTAGDSFNGPVGTTTAAAGAFTNLSASGTLGVTGIATLTAQPILSSLTASRAVFTDASKGLVSNAITGTGNVVMSASPTLTGTTSIATLNLTNALGAAYGGTGLTGFTANGVVYASSTSALATGSALTFDGTSFGVSTQASRKLTVYVDNPAVVDTVLLKSTNPASGYLRDVGLEGENVIFKIGSTTSTSGSEQMRLTSTGLGIGTSSPAYKLDVLGTSRIYQSGNTAASLMLNANQGALSTGYAFTLAQSNSSNNYNFTIAEGATTYLTLTNSISGAGGNLGLGVTPSAWGGNYKGFQVAATGAFASNGSNGTALTHNAYYDGTNDKYLINGAASRVFQFNGGIRFDLAASGTAGAAITFTQAMTLDASGNLGIGVTSPTQKLSLGGNLAFHQSSNLTTTTGYLNIAPSSTLILDTGDTIQFRTSGSERARIDSAGNLLVGTTTSVDQRVRISYDGSSPSWGMKMHSTATSGDNKFIEFGTEDSFTARGSITYNRAGGLTAYNTTSDYRAKDIIGLVTDSGALIDATPVYMGKMKGATQERPMFIAHETPAYAHTGEKDAVDADGKPVYQQMDASALVPVMWAEIQDLRKRLAAAGI